MDKEVACGRVAIGGHALAVDLVNVPRLGDTRPREVDMVAIKVWERRVEAEKRVLDTDCLTPDKRLALPPPTAEAFGPPASRAHDDIAGFPVWILVSITVKDDLEAFRCAGWKVEGKLDAGREDLLRGAMRTRPEKVGDKI